MVVDGEPHYLSFDELLLTESLGPHQVQQLRPVVDALLRDGMGLIPTDTQHAYVTPISSRKGVKRIYDIKGLEPDERKPMSLLCADLAMASRYADISALPGRTFAQVRKMLPGPYTLIFTASKEVPKVILEHKGRRRIWERREIGIRIPDCAVVQHLTRELDEPLLASSACDGPAVVWESQRHALDFVVGGSTLSGLWDELAEEDRISTIIDFTLEEPQVIRQGMGDASMFLGGEED